MMGQLYDDFISDAPQKRRADEGRRPSEIRRRALAMLMILGAAVHEIVEGFIGHWTQPGRALNDHPCPEKHRFV